MTARLGCPKAPGTKEADLGQRRGEACGVLRAWRGSVGVPLRLKLKESIRGE